MFHLNESFYKQEMPARAKRLFVRTFNKYHKLDGGDEEVALHMARQAVDREYVMLNNHWIPKTAAEEIVRHDIHEDSLSESEDAPSPSAAAVVVATKQKQRRHQKQPVSHKRSVYKQLSESENDNDYSTNDDDDNDDDDEDATSESDADDVGSQSHIKNKQLFK
ncbi:AC58/59-like protein [Mythimna sequax nucleopolyhedrovirus]|nr:AC58/59-like protein [Mythimna sequax nucleopolyhedrovirus]